MTKYSLLISEEKITKATTPISLHKKGIGEFVKYHTQVKLPQIDFLTSSYENGEELAEILWTNRFISKRYNNPNYGVYYNYRGVQNILSAALNAPFLYRVCTNVGYQNSKVNPSSEEFKILLDELKIAIQEQRFIDIINKSSSIDYLNPKYKQILNRLFVAHKKLQQDVKQKTEFKACSTFIQSYLPNYRAFRTTYGILKMYNPNCFSQNKTMTLQKEDTTKTFSEETYRDDFLDYLSRAVTKAYDEDSYDRAREEAQSYSKDHGIQYRIF